jgi:Ca2+-binding RTX toxin-like protein
MENLRLERVPIQLFGLGLFGFDHLQIVWERNQTQTDQARWYVLEGLRDAVSGGPVLSVEGTDGATTLSQANGGARDLDLVKAIGTPETRGSVILPTSGAISGIWSSMAAFGADIDQQRLPYIAVAAPNAGSPTINSSSVVASLLFHAGFNIAYNLPIGMGFSPGMNTLIGTSNGDTMQMADNFTALVGGGGNDTLSGGDTEHFIEKYSGGVGNDVFRWSEGINILHGGQARLDYAADGYDTVDYVGVGLVEIDAFPFAVPHFGPDYIAVHSGSVDQLYSIEGILWSPLSDTISLGQNVYLISKELVLKLGSEATDGQGDRLSFDSSKAGLSINSASAADDGLYFVQGDTTVGSSAGIWLDSAEWIAGSKFNDTIYGNQSVRGLEGNAGDDLLDARDATAFTKSHNGYDVELFGGEGDDTIVSGKGYSVATGGAGADNFVLSTLTEGSELVEFIIADATSDDRLYVPHNFFKNEPGSFEGSQLMAILGGFTQMPGENSFADLQENLGPWNGGPNGRSDFAAFTWELQDDVWQADNQTQGVIEFAGAIYFNREGSDLLIHIFSGAAMEVTEPGYADQDWTHTINIIWTATETLVRVTDFNDGDLGIQFHDRGEPTDVTLSPSGGRPIGASSFAGWDSAVLSMTNNGAFAPALDLRPIAPEYDPEKGETKAPPPQIISLTVDNDSFTLATGTGNINGGSGNDIIETSAGNDTIDGGSGNDKLIGGRGNDSYTVDSAGDTIVEMIGGGLDSVSASVSYTLSENVESLELTGSAIQGIGNETVNGLFGNELNNVLLGKGGDDVLAGGAGRDHLSGGLGSDTYLYSRGDGDDVIVDDGPAGDIDILRFTDIDASDISLHVAPGAPDDLIVSVHGGGRIVLTGFLSGNGQSVDQVTFSDGTIWTRAQIEALAAAAPRASNDAPQAIDDFGFAVRSGTTHVSGAAFTQNDIDYNADALRITSISNVTPGIAVILNAAGDLTVYTPDGYQGLTKFDYAVSDGTATSTATAELTVMRNFAPVQFVALPDPVAHVGQAFTYILPIDTFIDNEGDPFRVSASAAGNLLPSWLSFDSATGTFSGTPPADAIGTISLELSADDGAGVGTIRFFIAVEAALPQSTIITGTGTADVLTGTASADVINGGSGNDVMYGLAGNDIFLVQGKNQGYDTFFGGSGIDTISGGTGNDVIRIAASGSALSGIEVIDGGTGFDVLRFETTTAVSTVARIQAGNVIDLSDVKLIGIELIASGAGDDFVTGSAGNDRISGGRGDDTLRGGAGDDTFVIKGGAGGNDIYQGGAGFDQIAGSANDDIIGLANGLTGQSSIEAINAGDGFDVLRLTSGNDVLNLSTVSVTGLELINAGAGNDRVAGSQGNDHIRGGADDDTFIFHGTFGNDVVLDFQRGTARDPLRDVIDLTGTAITSFAGVISHAVETASGALITVGTQGSILLEGIHVNQLKADDFVL